MQSLISVEEGCRCVSGTEKPPRTGLAYLVLFIDDHINPRLGTEGDEGGGMRTSKTFAQALIELKMLKMLQTSLTPKQCATASPGKVESRV
jgi:hypothetical protein